VKVAGETWQRSRRTSPAAGSYIQPCSNFQCFVYVYVAYPMSLTKACFSPLSFFTKIRVLQAVIFLTAGDRNLTVHKRWPLKWKVLTSNWKECDRITLNRIESLLTEMIPRERAFVSTNLCVLRLLCECRFSACLILNHGTTKQCRVQFQYYFWWHFFWPLWNTYYKSSLLSLRVTRFSAKHILLQVDPFKGIRKCYTP